MKPIVPVGARTVTWAFRYPNFSPWLRGFVPALFAAFVEGGGDVGFVDVVDGRAVHADYVQEWFAVDVPAWAGGAWHGIGVREAQALLNDVAGWA